MKKNTNPWEEISLLDYEKHMSLDSVKQLQTLNEIMKRQFCAYPANTLMILGVAGGNGLEHINQNSFQKVYGVDVNGEYLRVVSDRYGLLGDILECLQIDLLQEVDKLPKADLLLANLLIEYIGYHAFQKAVKQVNPAYVSCVIQINQEEAEWVSDSPYIHAFDELDAVHHQLDQVGIKQAMTKIGYGQIYMESEPLPNGKALLRLDYRRKEL